MSGVLGGIGSMLFGGGMRPPSPAPAPAPAQPEARKEPETPTPTDPDARAAQQRQRRQQGARRGRQGTILTSPEGLGTGGNNEQGRSLLGG